MQLFRYKSIPNRRKKRKMSALVSGKGTIGGFDGSHALVLIVEKAKDEQLMAASNISVIFQVVEKFMARHLTCGRICAGTRASGRLCAIGYFAENDSLDPTSCNAIEELIQVKNVLHVQNAANVSCEATICQSMYGHTQTERRSKGMA